MSLAVGQVFADFEILGEIGRGGMGAVYQARQISLQRIIALKILPPHLATTEDSKTRFQTEAVAAAGLNHPNIVQVFAAGEQGGIRYIAMEYVEGESIQTRIKRMGRLPLTEALDIAYHIAAALDHAWTAAKLVHRDVKPDNIFLATSGTVKLGDFGLAKLVRADASNVTVTGHAMGSPHFISPEQAHGRKDIDFRADIYSLGCALHYMATGRMVFEGPDFLSVVLKHVNEQPAPVHTVLPDSPASLNRLLDRMLEKDPAARQQSYAELMEEIAHARQDAEVWQRSDARQRRRMSAPPESPRRVYLIAVLGVLLVAGGYGYAKRADRLRNQRSSVLTLVDPSDRRDFIESMARLPVEDRVRRVLEKMHEVNPAFSGKAKKTYEDDVVVELSFSSLGVTNLWPLCALPHLRLLKCTGDSSNHVHGQLLDLSPLAALEELEEVDVSWNPLHDLRPLAELFLKSVRCANTHVEDLAPLKGLGLTELDISSTPVRDAAALAGMPLEELNCSQTRIRDLSPLRDAPLRTLRCDPHILHGDLVRSWKRLETINDMPPLEILRRQRPRFGERGPKQN